MKYFKAEFLDFSLKHNMALLTLRSAQNKPGKSARIVDKHFMWPHYS